MYWGATGVYLRDILNYVDNPFIKLNWVSTKETSLVIKMDGEREMVLDKASEIVDWLALKIDPVYTGKLYTRVNNTLHVYDIPQKVEFSQQ